MNRLALYTWISIFRHIPMIKAPKALRFQILAQSVHPAFITTSLGLIMNQPLFLHCSAHLCAHIAPQLCLLSSHLALSKGHAGIWLLILSSSSCGAPPAPLCSMLRRWHFTQGSQRHSIRTKLYSESPYFSDSIALSYFQIYPWLRSQWPDHWFQSYDGCHSRRFPYSVDNMDIRVHPRYQHPYQ